MSKSFKITDDAILNLPAVRRHSLIIIERYTGRQSIVFKLQNADRFYALTITDTTAENKAGIQREAHLLKTLRRCTSDRYVEDGLDGPFTWLMMRWIEGRSIYERVKEIRAQDAAEVPGRLVRLYGQACEQIKSLHNQGYVHGDIQPAHFIIDASDAMHMLDFEWAAPSDAPPSLYRGGLVHYNAPEIAAALLSNSEDVPLDTSTDIYALGAVLFFLHTGHVVTNYGTQAYKQISLQKKLEAIAEGRIMTFAQWGIAPWPALETILSSCLAYDRTARCADLDVIGRQLHNLEQLCLP